MKKLVTFFAIILASSFIFAELHKPNRYFEIGVDAEGGASNNCFAATEFMVKELVFDLQKMADSVPETGWNIDLYAREKNFLNLNIGRTFRLGVFAGVEACGNINIGKELFDFLGKGYSAGTSETLKIDTYGDAYLTAGVSIGTRISGLGIKVTPSYYVPVIYIPGTSASISWSTTEDGEIKARAETELEVYSAFDLARLLESDDYEYIDDAKMNEQIQKSIANGGFDISVELEYPFLESLLEAGVFARIPLIPGKLKYKASRSLYVDFYQSNFLGKLNDDSETRNEHEFGEFSYYAADKKVYRPLRFGAEAVYRPFGNWFELRPMVALVMRGPYNPEERVIYPEYSLDATLSIANILAFNAGTAYLDKVFTQRVGLMINARVLEFNAQVAFRSGTFSQSFKGAGIGAFAGVRIGF